MFMAKWNEGIKMEHIKMGLASCGLLLVGYFVGSSGGPDYTPPKPKYSVDDIYLEEIDGKHYAFSITSDREKHVAELKDKGHYVDTKKTFEESGVKLKSKLEDAVTRRDIEEIK